MNDNHPHLTRVSNVSPIWIVPLLALLIAGWLALRSWQGRGPEIQIVFDDEGKIYATVQGKKLIHVFNTNYELIDSIETKLFPLFPLITKEGLQCIGSYTSIGYYGYYYGFEFNFNRNKCAIEVF